MEASAQIFCMDAPWNPSRAKQATAASRIRWRGGTVVDDMAADLVRVRMNVHVLPGRVLVNGGGGGHPGPMTDLPDIEILAAALGIPLRPEWHETIRQNLAVSLRLGALVGEVELPDGLEAAPVFEA